ncbi:hypothetical protein [Streptomyces sp. B15]|uniref:hypothetical protein n=1 Tax=Streptomyces sp. B15 TaxID=1537797 RepID=UPI001B375768|nr:hypothetical protein [Streptomyces sp. B15]MBQ1122214.1 hypothetical protein [Streptomyces sp. B15]
MAVQNRQRTVHFYQFADVREPAVDPLPWQNWERLLRRLRDLPVPDRTVESGGETFIGAVDPQQTAPHLLLAKVRRDHPQQIDFADGSLSKLQLAADKGLVEVTTVLFLPYGNVLATMGGGMSAPRVSAIQRWFGGMALLREQVELRPVVNAQSRDKLAHAQAVDSLEVRVQPEPYDSPSSLRAASNLGSGMNRIREEFPDMTITLKIEVPKRGRLTPRRRSRGQRHLLDSTAAFARDIGDWLDNTDSVDVAHARAHVEEYGQQSKNEVIDFVSERITAKCQVPLGATDGHHVDIHVALEKLAQASRDRERELRSAVGADI